MIKRITSTIAGLDFETIPLTANDHAATLYMLKSSVVETNVSDFLLNAQQFATSASYVDSEFTDITQPYKYALNLKIVPAVINTAIDSLEDFISKGLLALPEDFEFGNVGSQTIIGNKPYRAKRDGQYYNSAVCLDALNGFLYNPSLPAGKSASDFQNGLAPLQTLFYSVPPEAGIEAWMGQTNTHEIVDGKYVNLTQLLLNMGPADLFDFHLENNGTNDHLLSVDIDTSLFNIVHNTVLLRPVMLPKIGCTMMSLLTADPEKCVANINNVDIPVLIWVTGVTDLNPEV